jgi:acyl carrier protein
MSNINNTTAKLRTIIAEQLMLGEDEIINDSNLAVLGMDSLDRVELEMSIEDEFEIEEIPEHDLDNIETFGELARYVDGRIPAEV